MGSGNKGGREELGRREKDDKTDPNSITTRSCCGGDHYGPSAPTLPFSVVVNFLSLAKIKFPGRLCHAVRPRDKFQPMDLSGDTQIAVSGPGPWKTRKRPSNGSFKMEGTWVPDSEDRD